MNVADLLDDIQVLDEELRSYERKYGVLTETFAEAYAAGEEPADPSWVPDWTAWASAHDLRQRRRRQYQAALDSFRNAGHSTSEVIERAARHEPIPVPA